MPQVSEKDLHKPKLLLKKIGDDIVKELNVITKPLSDTVKWLAVVNKGSQLVVRLYGLGDSILKSVHTLINLQLVTLLDTSPCEMQLAGEHHYLELNSALILNAQNKYQLTSAMKEIVETLSPEIIIYTPERVIERINSFIPGCEMDYINYVKKPSVSFELQFANNDTLDAVLYMYLGSLGILGKLTLAKKEIVQVLFMDKPAIDNLFGPIYFTKQFANMLKKVAICYDRIISILEEYCDILPTYSDTGLVLHCTPKNKTTYKNGFATHINQFIGLMNDYFKHEEIHATSLIQDEGDKQQIRIHLDFLALFGSSAKGILAHLEEQIAVVSSSLQMAKFSKQEILEIGFQIPVIQLKDITVPKTFNRRLCEIVVNDLTTLTCKQFPKGQWSAYKVNEKFVFTFTGVSFSELAKLCDYFKNANLNVELINADDKQCLKLDDERILHGDIRSSLVLPEFKFKNKQISNSMLQRFPKDWFEINDEKIEEQEITYIWVFKKKQYFNATRLFFSYLDYRYPNLSFTTTKSQYRLNISIASNEFSFEDNPDSPKLLNDLSTFMMEIVESMSTIRKKYGPHPSWDKASSDIKRTIGKKLARAICVNQEELIHCFFKYNDWQIDDRLPIEGNPTPLEYAQKVNANMAYRYLHTIFTEQVRSVAGDIPVMQMIASSPENLMDMLSHKVSGILANTNQRNSQAQLFHEIAQAKGIGKKQKKEKKIKTATIKRETSSSPTAAVKNVSHAGNKMLKVLRSIVTPILGIPEWQKTNDGFKSIIRSKKNTETPEQYQIKCHNMKLMLDWVWSQCGIAANESKIICSESLKISLDCLQQPELLALFEKVTIKGAKKELLRHARHAASLVNKLEKKLGGIEAITALIPEASKKVKKVVVNEKVKKEETKQGRARPRRVKNRKKPRGKQNKVNVNSKQSIPKPKTIKPIKVVSSIPSQPLQRYRSLRPVKKYDALTLNSNNTTIWSTSANKPKKSPPEKVRELPLKKSFAQQPVLEKLYSLVTNLKTAVDNKSGKIMTRFAAWHYVHAQICNLLSNLDDDHFAKTQLFTHKTYHGKRTYARQKHDYIPDITFEHAGSHCFEDLSSLQAALLLLSKGKYPLQESIVQANDVIKGWASHVEAEFSEFKINKLTKNKDLSGFCIWRDKQIQQYTKAIKNLLEMPQSSVNEMAICFYVTRVGELVGHLPYRMRTSYLKFCRAFRNKASHSFSAGDLTDPKLDIDKLR